MRCSEASWKRGQGPVPSALDSPSYDNGTGALDPQFIRENRLPSHVKTARDLYAYQKQRDAQQLLSPSAAIRNFGQAGSLYSESSYFERDSYNSYSSWSGRSSAQGQSCEISRPLNVRGPAVKSLVHADPMVRGLRGLYAMRAFPRVLPGARRVTPYEGYWLHRGTLRKIPGEKAGKGVWWKKKQQKTPAKEATNSSVETSGWYSD
ncbi:hypothetical protein LTR84_004492 [Exophiala bonariae]|uniref:Uncharacterized protein n=1 Tax=Exophiala bonariae TaxID=1690606 RepID=A0AAV9N501_9EURO|nr:hypothetical protein LTR84_004492 [Exophiala bonariae]